MDCPLCDRFFDVRMGTEYVTRTFVAHLRALHPDEFENATYEDDGAELVRRVSLAVDEERLADQYAQLEAAQRRLEAQQRAYAAYLEAERQAYLEAERQELIRLQHEHAYAGGRYCPNCGSGYLYQLSNKEKRQIGWRTGIQAGLTAAFGVIPIVSDPPDFICENCGTHLSA